MRYLKNAFVISTLCLGSTLFSMPTWAAQKGKNNAAQEKKDSARIKDAKEDVSEAQKKIQAALKELKAAEIEARKSFDAIADAKNALDETSKRLGNWISSNLGIPEAIETQRSLQAAYDEATKPLIAAMKTNPKFMPLVERADKAEKLLKSLATNTELDETTRRQQQSAATKELADLKVAVHTHLESLSELKYPKEKLVAAQTKLADLRMQLKKQLEMHPDIIAAEKKRSQAKEHHEKDAQRVATLKRKAVSDESRLASERAQLAKANMLDKKNDGKNNNKNNNNKNRKKN